MHNIDAINPYRGNRGEAKNQGDISVLSFFVDYKRLQGFESVQKQ